MSEDNQRLRAIVYGRVQGVNYRSFAQRSAVGCGVTGWVRNLHDGAVETVAEGTSSALQAYLNALHVGPPASAVTRVDVNWEPYQNAFSDFSIRFG